MEPRKKSFHLGAQEGLNYAQLILSRSPGTCGLYYIVCLDNKEILIVHLYIHETKKAPLDNGLKVGTV